jgi:hydrogenase/urease accessory protein HupE
MPLRFGGNFQIYAAAAMPLVERLRVPVLLTLVTVSTVVGMTSGLAHGERANGIHAFQLFLGYGVIRASSVCGALIATKRPMAGAKPRRARVGG